MPAVVAPVDEALGVDQRIDGLVDERPREPAMAQRPRACAATAASRRSTHPPRATRPRPSRRGRASAASRKTSTNSSALDGKCRYSVPAATPVRSAIAWTDAAA